MLEPSLKTAFNHSHHPLNDSNLDNTTSYKMINRAIYWTSKVDSSLNWSLIQVRPLTSKKMKNKTFFNVGTTHKCSFSWFHYLYNLFSDNTGFFIYWISNHSLSWFNLVIHFNQQDSHSSSLEQGNLVRWAMFHWGRHK